MAKLKDAPKLVHTFTLSVEFRKHGKRLAPAEIIARGKVTSIQPLDGEPLGPWIVQGVVGEAFEVPRSKKIFRDDASFFDVTNLSGKKVIWGSAPKRKSKRKK